MIPAIVTLIVGVAIVIVSFFLTDGPKENTENSVMDESRDCLLYTSPSPRDCS